MAHHPRALENTHIQFFGSLCLCCAPGEKTSGIFRTAAKVNEVKIARESILNDSEDEVN